MYFFYYSIISFGLITSIYKYNKNFKNINQLISYTFKKILIFMEYKVDDINLDLMPSKILFIGSHTSIYDFIFGLLFYYGYLHEKYDSYILMKKEFESFCNPLLKFLDNKFKFISIDSQKKNNGVTEQMCEKLKDKDNYVLFIAPEGTRRCIDKLRSGYWVISKKLDINIIYFGIDFSNKSIVLENFRKPMENWDYEQEEFIKSCKKYVPLYPERCYWTKNFYN